MVIININSVQIVNSNPHKQILQDVRFELEKSKVYTILGRNGSGKSTLVNSMTGILDQNDFLVDGSVILEGKNLLEASIEDISKIRKEKIRYVFQDALNSFDPLKTFDYYFNMYGSLEEEIEDLFEYFLLPKAAKLFKLHPYEVSGGMAQRISICLALLAQPRLLILDEPSSAIDINISNLLCSKLREFVRLNESSVLLITQDLDFASHVSDFIAEMKDGRLSEFFPAENLDSRNVTLT